MALCIIQNIPIPEKDDPCDLWIEYFNKLEDRFGKENARMIWLKTWDVNGSTLCTTEPYFVDFIEKNGINVSNAATRLLANATEFGEGIFGILKLGQKMAQIAVPAIILIILYFLAKSAKSAKPADVAGLLPPVRAGKLALGASGALKSSGLSNPTKLLT